MSKKIIKCLELLVEAMAETPCPQYGCSYQFNEKLKELKDCMEELKTYKPKGARYSLSHPLDRAVIK